MQKNVENQSVEVLPSTTAKRKSTLPSILLGVSTFIGLYLACRYAYLLVEGFSIIVAFGVFILAWNSRHILENQYLLFVGAAYLFVGVFDFVHAMSYKGMGVFPGHDSNLATQLWIVARYMQALAFLLAPLALRFHFRARILLGSYTLITILLLVAIFEGVFPDCGPHSDGRGLTAFKIGSEYIICIIFFFAGILLYRYRTEFERNVFRLLLVSIYLTIASEFSISLGII